MEYPENIKVEYRISHLFNRPSTPQFGQPSKVAPAGRAPRAQWKKKRIREQGVKNLVRQSVSQSVWNTPKENKLGINK